MAIDQAGISAIIQRHLAELAKPGVLSVRPGFEVTHGWLTGRPAIVATVEHKVSDPAPADALPVSIEGVDVDVRQASTVKRESLENPASYAALPRLSPDTHQIPAFPLEHVFSSPGAATPVKPFMVELAKAPKPQLDYAAPAGASLAPVHGRMTVQLMASPDAGWTALKPYLAGTISTLTVAMYDFTSAHILSSLESSAAGKALKLVLDHPAKNPTADQTDEQTVSALRATLGDGLDQAWALERMDPLASAWIFPTAYHIKVAVRDSKEVWLSSGNWNNSNEPDIDPVTNAGDATAARSGDRDWHVIIQHAGLAKTFESFILNDLSVAAQHNVPPGVSAPTAASLATRAAETPPFATFYAAKTLSGTFTITPLLTPDVGVYAQAVKTLIASATHSLYLQFQYIELPTTTSDTSAAFVALVQAVIDRQTAGVDVRIIMSEYETSGYLEQLEAAGLDVVHNVKIQNNVHNKGVIVDGHTVLVSSQNWSTDGTLYNRDAGVIIANKNAATYFQQIFLHDWTNLAKQKATDD